MKYIIYLIVFFIISSSHLFAANEQEAYRVMGLGSQSCSAYLHDRQEGDAYFLAWLTGYLTAYNMFKEDTYHALGNKKVRDVQQWLTAYCTIHRDATFENAVKNMLKRFHGSRFRTLEDEGG